MIISRLTTVERDAISPSPIGGYVIYNTTLEKYQVYNQLLSIWEDVSTTNVNIYNSNGTLTSTRTLNLDNKTLQFITTNNGNLIFDLFNAGANSNTIVAFAPNGVDISTIDTSNNSKSTLFFSKILTKLGWTNGSGFLNEIQFGQTGILLEDTLFNKGIVGSNYYGANYDDNTYVQKKYVDDININNIVQNGNSFGTAVRIGSNDNFNLEFETNNTLQGFFRNSDNAFVLSNNVTTREKLILNNTVSNTNFITLIGNTETLKIGQNGANANGRSFVINSVTANKDIFAVNYDSSTNISSTFLGNDTSISTRLDYITATYGTIRAVSNSVGKWSIFDGTYRFTIEPDNTLTVGATTNYEALVTSNNDIPNRKFVTDYINANTIIQNGNTLGTNIIVGTNDAFNFSIETAGVTKATFDTDGGIQLFNLATDRYAIAVTNTVDDNNYTRFAGSTTEYLLGFQASRFLIKNNTTNRDIISYTHSTNSLTLGSSASSTQNTISLPNSNATYGGASIGLNSSRKFYYTDGTTVRFFIRTTNQIATDTPSYETLVTNDNDIPNKKYVDESINLRTITTIATNTTLANQYTALVDSTSGNITIALPAAAANNGRIYNVKKIVAANSVIIDPNLAETIDGNTTITLLNQWEAVTIQSNGVNWFILASF